jgi:organic hydroperoxide reductase OsmC/OhrA
MSTTEHTYSVQCTWEGSTAAGYDAYDRTHTGTATPSPSSLELSSDPAFRGDPQLLNPEQLLVLAASSCQLLTFLAVAARSRVDVVSYSDTAAGVMPEAEKPIRITRIDLRPHITIRGAETEERLTHLCDVAHNACFIANSLTTEIVITPTFTFVE